MANIYNRSKYGAKASFSAGVLMEDSEEEDGTLVTPVERASSTETASIETNIDAIDGVVAPSSPAVSAHIKVRPPHARPSQIVEQPSLDSYKVMKKNHSGVDFFEEFAERQVRSYELVGCVIPTDEQRERMLCAIEHFTTHAAERSWERIPSGVVGLSSCLDKEHKVMLTERVRVIVKGAGHINLDKWGTRVISCQEEHISQVTGVSEGLCDKDTATIIQDSLSRARIVAAARKKPGKAGAGHAASDEEDKGDMYTESLRGRLSVTEWFQAAFLAGLRDGTAQVFRVQAFKAVTMVGTLVFNEKISKLITVVKNKGDADKVVKHALRSQRKKQYQFCT